MTKLTDSPQWKALKSKYNELLPVQMRDWFAQDKKRSDRFSLEAAGLYLDFSKNRIDEETLTLLCELANACDLSERIESLFNGTLKNSSMKTAVLHTALRHLEASSIELDGDDVMHEIRLSWEKIRKIATRIRDGSYKGFTGKSITDVVNIGVGGSNLGAQMVYNALKPYKLSSLRCHFISNLDEANSHDVLQQLNPETTLFIIASKTLTTKETLENTHRAKQWLMEVAKDEALIRPHFMAATAAPGKAHELGVLADNIFLMWPWVGGRFSVWSAAGLCIAITMGWECFYEFLSGAYAMDTHFRETEFNKNMPVLLALLSIWYINFFDIKTQAVIPYSQRLYYFPDYLKQLHMESQGKSVRCDGLPVDYNTGPIIWGGVGTDSQHSFHQLFLQGTLTVPVDFIAVLKNHKTASCQFPLIANCLGQSETLMRGYDKEAIMANLMAQGADTMQAEELASQQAITGNNPSNTIILEQLTPYTLGSLIALYEHKVYVQSVIWNINAFDQWGVERGKRLADDVFACLSGNTSPSSFDSSTRKLINYVMSKNKKMETVS